MKAATPPNLSSIEEGEGDRCFGIVLVHIDADLAIVIRVLDVVVEAGGVVDLRHHHARLRGWDESGADDAMAGLDEPKLCDDTGAVDGGERRGEDDLCVLVKTAVVPAVKSGRAWCLLDCGVGEEIVLQGYRHGGGCNIVSLRFE